jgi:hypothetical protein
MTSKAILTQVVRSLWNVCVILVTRPKEIILGWLLGWSLILYKASIGSGFVTMFQLVTSSMLNFSSLVGLPIPMVALFILLIESLAKLFSEFFMEKIVTLINFIKRKLFNAGNKIKKAFSKLKIKKRKLKVSKSDALLGLGSEEDLLQDEREFEAAVDDLLDALQLEGYSWESG